MAWALQHLAQGFAFDVVAAHQPGAVAQAEFIGSRSQQADRLITQLASLLCPLQQLLSCGVAGILAVGCGCPKFPRVQRAELTQILWMAFEELKKMFSRQ